MVLGRSGDLVQLHEAWEKTEEALGPTNPTRFKVHVHVYTCKHPTQSARREAELSWMGFEPTISSLVLYMCIVHVHACVHATYMYMYIQCICVCVQVFEKLVEDLYTREQYKEALTVATALQSQLALTFTTGAADMMNKVEEHIKKYVHVYTCT